MKNYNQVPAIRYQVPVEGKVGNAKNLINKFAMMTCVSQVENAKNLNSKFIDPILDEMLLINFQPFYDFSFIRNQVSSRDQEPESMYYYTLNFTNWDKRLFNTLHLNGSLSNV